MGEFKCKKCGRCCMAFEIGGVRETWALDLVKKHGKWCVGQDEFGDYYVTRVPRPWAPAWAVEGVCIYLTEDKTCIIHDNRPQVCEWFECRGSKKRRLNQAIKELEQKLLCEEKRGKDNVRNTC